VSDQGLASLSKEKISEILQDPNVADKAEELSKIVKGMERQRP